MATVRFAVAHPQPPDLQVAAVPAIFENYIWDVDTDTEDGRLQAGRMRYIGQPYRVIELGTISD
jgi:hypothetical protein